jgi:hypothetical protein
MATAKTVARPKLPPQPSRSHVDIVDPPRHLSQARQPRSANIDRPARESAGRGIRVTAAVMTLVAAFFFINVVPDLFATHASIIDGTLGLFPAALLMAAGIGLWRTNPWGWWSACALFYFIALQSLTTIAQGLAGIAGVTYSVAAVMLTLAVAAIVTLNRSATLDNIRFSDQTPKLICSRVTPATAGFLFGLLIFLPEIIGR